MPGRGVWKLRVYLLAGFVLLSSFTIMLLYIKRPTQVIAFAVTNYAAPAPPNAWAAEDLGRLAGLSRTVRLQDISPEWEARNPGMEAWQTALASVAKTSVSHPLVIYISMHGVVNDEGQPCLLPPQTSPLSPVSFITVQSLLEQVEQTLPTERNILLVLDCQQQITAWEMGLLYNTFGERLEQLLENRAASNVAVLCAASPGQRSWAAPDMQGTAFGRFFELGLSGLADGFDQSRENGEVELVELAAYVRSHVEHWSRLNRGDVQSPRLYLGSQQNFRVSYVNRDRPSDLPAHFRDIERLAPNVTVDESSELWKKLDSLREYGPLHFAPERWRDLERRLVRLDALAHAGDAYRDAARRQLDSLSKDLARMTELGLSRSESECFVDRWGIVDAITGLEGIYGAGAKRSGEALPNLPLNRYFGLLSDMEIRDVQALASRLLTPQGGNLNIHRRDVAAKIESVAWLSAAQEEGVATMWAAPDRTQRVLASRVALEELSVPWDSATKSGDERSHYFVRQPLAEAMVLQRQLEDLLFLGEADAGRAIDEMERELRDRIAEIRELRMTATEACSAADRTWAELPYLADWFCHQYVDALPGSENHTQRTREQKEWVTRVVSLINSNRRLVNQLVKVKATDNAFVNPTRVVVGQLKELREEVLSQVSRFASDPAGDAMTYRTFTKAQRLPILPATTRHEIMRLFADVRANVHKKYVAALERSAPTDSDEPPPPNSVLAAIGAWARHPIAHLMLKSTVPETEARRGSLWEQLETSSCRLRSELAAFGAARRNETTEMSSDVLRHRFHFVAEEQALRAAAPLLFRVSTEGDPIGNLRKLDLKQLLLWHRRQLIEGMWHARWDSAQRSYVEVAAEECSRAFQNLRVDDALLQEILNGEIRKQDELLESRLAAQLRADPTASVTDEDQIEFHTQVKETVPGFPEGRAAVYVSKSGKRLVELPFKNGFALPYDASATGEYQFSSSKSAELSGELTATVFFRGRRFQRKFDLEPVDGLLVDYVPYRYGPPAVTLYGQVGRRSSYVFILDCSYSMRLRIPRKTERKDGGVASSSELDERDTVSKMDEAKRHLVAMLHRLADTEAHVGVKFVGHRVNYNSRGAKVPSPTWGDVSATLLPAEDVQSIHSLGRFDAVDASAVQDATNRLRPHGQSPLYLALKQAFREFDASSNERQGIIAITDGENVQHVTAGDAAAKPEMVTSQQLESSVPVHFFDFATATSQSRNQEFIAIARKTNGTYVSAASGEDLLQKLQKQLELDGYLVVDAVSGVALNRVEDGRPKPKQLNETLRFLEEQFVSDQYEIRFRDQARAGLKLEGGEALALELYDAGSDVVRIRSQYYPTVSETSAELLLRGDSKTGIRFDAHRPTRIGRGVQFTVSIQKENAAYTPRPIETWVEIIPDTGNPNEQPFVFYDTNFEPNKPVPELRWSVNDWPGARKATMQFWCKYDSPTQSVPIALGDLLNRPDEFNEYRDVGIGQGVNVRFSIDSISDGGKRIRVFQGSGGVGVRVAFETTSRVTPRRVKRRFDRGGRASHEFHFSAEEWEVLSKNARNTFIKIASREACHDGALRLREPVRVSVYGEGGLLPVTQ